MYANIVWERTENVVVITLNRPRVLNALNRALKGELADALAQIKHDREHSRRRHDGRGRAGVQRRAGPDRSEGHERARGRGVGTGVRDPVRPDPDARRPGDRRGERLGDGRGLSAGAAGRHPDLVRERALRDARDPRRDPGRLRPRAPLEHDRDEPWPLSRPQRRFTRRPAGAGRRADDQGGSPARAYDRGDRAGPQRWRSSRRSR